MEHGGRHPRGAARRRHRLCAQGTRRPGSVAVHPQRAARRRPHRPLYRAPRDRRAAGRGTRHGGKRRHRVHAERARKPDPAPGGRWPDQPRDRRAAAPVALHGGMPHQA
ncbi:histidine kinase, partial [Delftia tsuruhatensis]|nr:histidine kinase [Delftia tsuruhatensis]